MLAACATRLSNLGILSMGGYIVFFIGFTSMVNVAFIEGAWAHMWILSIAFAMHVIAWGVVIGSKIWAGMDVLSILDFHIEDACAGMGLAGAGCGLMLAVRLGEWSAFAALGAVALIGLLNFGALKRAEISNAARLALAAIPAAALGAGLILTALSGAAD